MWGCPTPELAPVWLSRGYVSDTLIAVDEQGLRRVQMANVAGYSNVPIRAVR